MQFNEEIPVEFMGNESCLMARITCMGAVNPYSFPPPKPDRWIAIPIFRALDGINPVEILKEYQPKAASVRIHVENGCELAYRNAFVNVSFGELKTKTDPEKRTKNPVWAHSQIWFVYFLQTK